MKKPIIWLVLLALVTVFAGCAGSGEKIQTKTPAAELNEIVDVFIDSDPGSVDSDTIKYWCDDSQQAILNNLEGSYVAEVLFVRAYITLYTGDSFDAAKLFEECIKAADPRTYNDMIAKCNYELARHVLFNAMTSSPDAYIDNISNAYDGTSDRNRQITLIVNLASEVAQGLNNQELALELVTKATNLADQFSYSDMLYLNYSAGHIYIYFNLTQASLQYFYQALDYATDNGDSLWVAKINCEIAETYYERENYENARNYFLSAYEQYEKIKDESEDNYFDMVEVADRISKVCCNLKSFDEADSWLDKERNLLDKAPNGSRKEDAVTYFYCTLAERELIDNNTETALNYLKTARDRYSECEDFHYVEFDIKLNKLFGKVYMKIGNAKIAKQYYLDAVNGYTRLHKSPDMECYGALFEACKSLGNLEQAIMYGEKYTEALNKIMEESKNDQSEYILQTFESDRRQKEIDLLKTNNNLLLLLVASGIILVGVSSYLGIVSLNKSKENRKLNEKLVKTSKIDELTQLNNRRSLSQFLDEKWDEIYTSGKPVSVAMMDVDFFKKYNDYYGHLEGDNVLSEVGLSIMENCEETDFAARYGGEEFIIIMPGTDEETARKRMENIRKTLSILRIEHAESTVSKYVTISVGIATSTGIGRYMSLISAADGALYKAKETRNTIESVFYE